MSENDLRFTCEEIAQLINDDFGTIHIGELPIILRAGIYGKFGESFTHDFNIVIGPIANDGVAYLLGRYEEGALTIEELSDKLDYKKLNSQYFFGTDKSLKYLKRL